MASTTEGAVARCSRIRMASDRSVVARALYEERSTDMRPALPAMRTPLTDRLCGEPYATEARFGG